MENTFNKRTLEEILRSNSRVLVPNYQRNFVWGKNEANNLIQDIVDTDEGSFLGTIVFHKQGEDLIVVDGQQRLTSIFILLSALRRRAKDLKLPELAGIIQDKIAHVDQATGESVGSKIEVSPVIRFVFNETILDQNWSGDFTIEKFKNKKLEVRKVKPIYDEFWKFIKTLSEKDLKSFLRKLYSSHFGEIVIFEMAAAFEIFERMNARGVELNAADLLKNHLFAELYDNPDINVEEIWREISDNAPGLLRMLRYYYTSRGGYVSYKNLFKALKDYSNNVGTLTLLRDIQDFSYLYSVLYSPSYQALEEILIDRYELSVFSSKHRLDQILRNFKAYRLFGVTQCYPLLMSLFYSFINDSERDEKSLKMLQKTLNNLEKFLFINHGVVGNPGNAVEQEFAKLAAKIYKEGTFEEDCKLLDKFTKEELEERVQFEISFTSISYDSKYLSTIYYIFDRFTNYKQKGEQVVEIFDTDTRVMRGGFNIEHLAPQANRDGTNDDVIDNIGNLLVISRHTNSSLGSLGFKEKMEILKKKQNRLNIVDEFIKDYGNQEEWAEDDVQNRATKMAGLAFDEVWKLN